MKMDYELDALDRAIYETVHQYRNPTTGKRGATALAPLMGMPPSTLQNKADPKQEFTHLTVKEARSVILLTGDMRILKTLAAETGHAMVALPTLDFPADMDLLEAWAKWQAEIAETVQKIKGAVADKKITQDEIAEIRMELIEDFEEGMKLLDVLKGMAEPEGKRHA